MSERDIPSDQQWLYGLLIYLAFIAIIGVGRIVKYFVGELFPDPSVSVIVLVGVPSLVVALLVPVWVFRVCRYLVRVAERNISGHGAVSEREVSESTKAVEPTGTSTDR